MGALEHKQLRILTPPPLQVKRMMFINENVRSVRPEAALAMSKATEGFIKMLAKIAFREMQISSSGSKGRHTVYTEDIGRAIEHNEDLGFLVDCFGPLRELQPQP